MELSSETFYSIVKALRSDHSSGKSLEKRKSPRVGLRAKATILINSPAGPNKAIVNVRDLSKSGIGLVHNERIPPGTTFTLCLPGGGKDGVPADITFEVAVCRPVGDGFYAIGAKLV